MAGQVCPACGEEKSLDQFKVKLNGARNQKCIPCAAAHNDQWRTPDKMLRQKYASMKQRVSGRHTQERTVRRYTGLSLLPRDEFIAWAKDDPEFWRLYHRWVAAGRINKLAPSINRIDPDKGYELGNLEWLTKSVNCSLARPCMQTVLQRVYDQCAA